MWMCVYSLRSVRAKHSDGWLPWILEMLFQWWLHTPCHTFAMYQYAPATCVVIQVTCYVIWNGFVNSCITKSIDWLRVQYRQNTHTNNTISQNWLRCYNFQTASKRTQLCRIHCVEPKCSGEKVCNEQHNIISCFLFTHRCWGFSCWGLAAVASGVPADIIDTRANT